MCWLLVAVSLYVWTKHKTTIPQVSLAAVEIRRQIPGTSIRLIGPPGEARFAVWGDSHASALLPVFNDLAYKAHVHGIGFIGLGLAPLTDAYNRHSPVTLPGQDEWSLHVRQWIVNNDVKYVFLVARWDAQCPRWCPTMHFNNDGDRQDFLNEWRSRMVSDESTDKPSIQDSARTLQASLASTLTDLNDATDGKKRHVYVVMQAPIKDGAGEDPVSEETYRIQQTEMLKFHAAMSGPDTHCDTPPVIIGPAKWWFKNGMSVTRDEAGDYYSDRHHVSTYGGKKFFEPLLEPVFKQMVE
jgi:hypothetical protein